MTTSSTDLRYGRRGGGWVPKDRVKETAHPHRLQPIPCSEPSCGGFVYRPIPRPTEPYIEVCDGLWKHEKHNTPLEPHFPPEETR